MIYLCGHIGSNFLIRMQSYLVPLEHYKGFYDIHIVLNGEGKRSIANDLALILESNSKVKIYHIDEDYCLYKTKLSGLLLAQKQKAEFCYLIEEDFSIDLNGQQLEEFETLLTAHKANGKLYSTKRLIFTSFKNKDSSICKFHSSGFKFYDRSVKLGGTKMMRKEYLMATNEGLVVRDNSITDNLGVYQFVFDALSEISDELGYIHGISDDQLLHYSAFKTGNVFLHSSKLFYHNFRKDKTSEIQSTWTRSDYSIQFGTTANTIDELTMVILDHHTSLSQNIDFLIQEVTYSQLQPL